MAAKLQHVHDSCVVERRLRPIYDWLDLGNNKRALQEIEKVLKKSPALQCARALRCLATWRLGREKEALAALETLAAETPADDATLQVMAICYRESQQLEKVCSAYEAAVEKDPSNEELHTHLFMAYVRVGALERQQHAALRLYRHSPKAPYYLWAAVSVVLQATRASACTVRAVLLELAQRMLDRLRAEPRAETAQELRLYLHVLTLRGQHARALQLLREPRAARALPAAFAALAPPLLRELRRWRRLNRLAKGLLRAEPDRWDLHLLYLDSAGRLMDGEGEEEEEPGEAEADPEAAGPEDSSPAACAAFLAGVLEGSAGGRALRGPHLARLELYKRLRTRNIDATGLLGEASDLLLDYFRRFGHKACCAEDLRPYLELAEPRELAAALEREGADCDERALTAAKLRSCCGAPLGALPDAPGAEELAAHALHAEALAYSSSAPLLRGLLRLHAALDRDPGDYHCKLLAIKFYHILGCGTSAHKIHEDLDVKHIQLDSLAHIHCTQLARSGLPTLAQHAYSATSKFFSHSYKDSVDHLTFSYKFGSFMKLEELMDWRERLHASLQRAWCEVEGAHLALLRAAAPAEADAALLAAPAPPLWERLADNRDTAVSRHWDAPAAADPAGDAEQFRQERAYLRLRSAALEGLRAAQRLAAGEEGARAELAAERARLAELRAEERARAPAPVRARSAAGPLPSRLLALLAPPLLETYEAGLECAGESPEPEREELCAELLLRCHADADSAIQRQLRVADPLWTQRETIETVVNFLEVVSVLCTVCGQWRGPKGARGARRGGPLVAALLRALGALPTSLLAWGFDAPPAPSGLIRALNCLQQAIKDKIKFLQSLA